MDTPADLRNDRARPPGPQSPVQAGGEPPGQPPEPIKARSQPTRFLLLAAVAVALLAGGYVGYSYWQDQLLYVSTDNASVVGVLVQVGSLNTGQVSSVGVGMGDRVARDQVVATVLLPASIGATSSGSPKLAILRTDDHQVSVRSPVDGIVVNRQANPGDTVAAGQPILTVLDPTQLWVQAQIEETKIGRVRAYQPVEVQVDALGESLPGQVVAVGQASVTAFTLMPQGGSGGSKVTQLVPVKIAVAAGQLPLVLGGSVEVKIRVQE